jgi:glyoxylase-like metal-dependent hydrolase (beta-lactamase superfamily II)
MDWVLLAAGNASSWTGPTGNNTYLIQGNVPTLIDAGVGEPAHLAAIEDGLAGRALAQVLVTHGHVDHIAGLPALRERWPSVDIRDAFVDGERIAAGDTVLRVVHTPGHAPDHVCFLDEAIGDLFCGDLLRHGGTVVIPASKGGDLADYLRSLHRVRALRPRRLLPAHGPIVEDPIDLIDEYVRHREARERQVIEALRSGCSTPEDMVRRIYDNLPGPLVSAAADSVLAHLVKLEREHRARRTGNRWTLAGGT